MSWKLLQNGSVLYAALFCVAGGVAALPRAEAQIRLFPQTYPIAPYTAEPDYGAQEGASCEQGDCLPGGGYAGCGNGFDADWACLYERYFAPIENRVWVRGEYLLWWTKGMGLPPLVTTSPSTTPPALAGVLGQDNTTVLSGGEGTDVGAQSGGRIAFGYWFTPCQTRGIEASYLGVGRGSDAFRATSAEIGVLARPYFDTQAGVEASMLIAHPDFLSGSVDVDVHTELQAVEVLGRRCLIREENERIDFLAGYRFARLDESLRIAQFSKFTAGQGQIVAGTTKELFDLFDTENRFHGGQVGAVYQGRMGIWSLELLAKLGLGNTYSRVRIDGSTTTTVPEGGSATFPGGLLAQPTNTGLRERNRFAVIPEAGATLGCDLTYRLRATFGYTLLYWSRVARPGDQIDRAASQLPPEPPTGALRPAFQFATSGFWAQGLNFGLDYRF